MRAISPIATLLVCVPPFRHLAGPGAGGPRSAAATPVAAATVEVPAGPQLTREDVEAWLDGFMNFALAARQHPRSRRRRRQGRRGPRAERLRLRRCREAKAGRSGADTVPPGLRLQALHLDGCDAAGRARKVRPRRRRQPVPRLQDSAGTRRRAGHAAKHHDPHAGLRRGGQGVDHREPGSAHPARRGRESVDSEPHLQGRHDAGVFELCDSPRGIHGRARLGPDIRRLPRPEYLPAAWHDELVVPAAVAQGARSRHVPWLQVRTPTSRKGTSSSASHPRARWLQPAPTWRGS